MNLTNEQVSQIPTMLSSYLSLSDSIKGFSIQYTKETSESINRYIRRAQDRYGGLKWFGGDINTWGIILNIKFMFP